MDDIAIQLWGVIGTWVAGIGTVSAVILSLWFAYHQHTIKLDVKVGHRKMVSQGSDEHPEYCMIRVVNTGFRVANITSIGWECGWLKSKQHLIQIFGTLGSANVPKVINQGEEAVFLIPFHANENDNDWIISFPKALAGDKGRISNIKRVKAVVVTSVGQIFKARVEKSLLEVLLNSYRINREACGQKGNTLSWNVEHYLGKKTSKREGYAMMKNDYLNEFTEPESSSKKLIEAFHQASDIRKFEIELYWKRAGYFWALIAVAFAGYFGIISATKIDNKYFLSFLVASVGIIFTFAWHLVNRGSKYWQENWENHLALLEDGVTGPLYKTLLQRPKLESVFEKMIYGPKSISVSKINQWVSVYVFSVWVFLFAYSAYMALTKYRIGGVGWLLVVAHIIVALIVLMDCIFMYRKGGTDKSPHVLSMVKLSVEIEGKK